MHSMMLTVIRVFACSALFAGCALSAAPMSDSEPEIEHATSELSVPELRLFRAALVGISSDGSEGDPVPYRAIVVTAKPGDAWVAETLAARIGPKIPDIREKAAVYGYQSFTTGSDMANYWADATAIQVEPDADADAVAAATQRSERMQQLRVLCDQNLTHMTHMVVGVRSDKRDPGSIENGAVAPMLVGQLPSGKWLVMYGIDIWT
jgi:hypothetical protein